MYYVLTEGEDGVNKHGKFADKHCIRFAERSEGGKNVELPMSGGPLTLTKHLADQTETEERVLCGRTFLRESISTMKR